MVPFARGDVRHRRETGRHHPRQLGVGVRAARESVRGSADLGLAAATTAHRAGLLHRQRAPVFPSGTSS